MIKKIGNLYYLYSLDGKRRLSKGYPSRNSQGLKDAEKRALFFSKSKKRK